MREDIRGQHTTATLADRTYRYGDDGGNLDYIVIVVLIELDHEELARDGRFCQFQRYRRTFSGAIVGIVRADRIAKIACEKPLREAGGINRIWECYSGRDGLIPSRSLEGGTPMPPSPSLVTAPAFFHYRRFSTHRSPPFENVLVLAFFHVEKNSRDSGEMS